MITFSNVWKLAQYLVLLLAGLLLAGGLTRCAGRSVPIARLTVLVSGQTMGYLEHCGCSSGVTGGELRKARMMRQEREEAVKPKKGDQGLPAEVVLIELGDFSDSSSPVQKLLSTGVVKSMKELGYHSIGIGLQELEYPQEEFFELVGEAGLTFTAANLRFVKPQQGADKSADLAKLIVPYRVSTLDSGHRVGVVHVIDDRVGSMRDVEQRKFSELNGFEISSAADAARKVLDEHSDEADTWIVTVGSAILQGAQPEAFGSLEPATLVIGISGSNPDRSAESPFPQFIDRPYQKAKDVILCVINYEKGKPRIIQPVDRLNLLPTLKEDDNVKQIIAALKPDLQKLENEQAEEAWSQSQELPHPWYVGHNACMTCHANIVESLSHTKHREAFDNLVHRGPDSQKDPRCLPCHVTGHNKPGGWNRLASAEIKDMMKGVSCEACHGPGEYHVKLLSAAEGWQRPADLAGGGRGPLGIARANQETCLKCHDDENSPSFNFGKYWPHIQHNQEMSVVPKPGSPEKPQGAMALPGRGFGNITVRE